MLKHCYYQLAKLTSHQKSWYTEHQSTVTANYPVQTYTTAVMKTK